MQKQLVPLTLTPRRVCRSGGAVEERDWQGGGALVGKGVWKLKTMVGWGRGGTLAVRRVLRGGAGRGWGRSPSHVVAQQPSGALPTRAARRLTRWGGGRGVALGEGRWSMMVRPWSWRWDRCRRRHWGRVGREVALVPARKKGYSDENNNDDDDDKPIWATITDSHTHSILLPGLPEEKRWLHFFSGESMTHVVMIIGQWEDESQSNQVTL